MTGSSQRLHAIADLLGVPTEAFSASSDPHLLHATPSGDRWLLVTTRDTLMVRHVEIDAAGGRDLDLSLGAFLRDHVGSPQHEALLGLIQEALVAHLA